MSERASVRERKCPSVQVSESASVRACKCPSAQVSESASVRACKCPRAQVSERASERKANLKLLVAKQLEIIIIIFYCISNIL